MKDIVALIKWVKSNAKSFGGDPYSITLFGGSSGAAAIDYVTLSPMSEDLFERIILTSGTASNFWGFSEDPLKWTFKLGRKLNINTNNVNVLMENLKNVSPSMLALAAEQIDKRDTSHPFSLIFVPCAESIIDGEKSIITKSPTSILKTGNYYKVPQIISFTNNEGYTYLEQMKKNLNNLDSMLELLIPKTILKRLTGAKMKNEILKRIKQFYFKGSKITNATLQNFVDFLSDTIILYDLHNNLKVKLKHNTNPIYYTEFGYEMKKKTPRKHVPKDNLSFESLPRKVGHGDDLAYVFTFSQEMIADDDIVTKKVVDRQVTMIYNFAKYG